MLINKPVQKAEQKEKLINCYVDFSTWKFMECVRLEDGSKERREVRNWVDNFYVRKDSVDKLRPFMDRITKVVKSEKLDIEGNEVYKVYCKGIFSKGKIYKQLMNDGNLDGILEADLSVVDRYVLDKFEEIPLMDYHLLYVDIETTTNEGFPEYQNPVELITCITLYDSFKKEYVTFALDNGIEEPTTKDTILFKDEKRMLERFLELFEENDYDAVIGWNVGFDLSYLVSRIQQLGLNHLRLSPSKSVKIYQTSDKTGMSKDMVSIGGRFVFDLLELYRSVMGRQLVSYALKHVSEKEFGVEEKKRTVLDFTDEWKNHINELLTYNRYDVELLVKLNEKLKLVEYFDTLRHLIRTPDIDHMKAKVLIDFSILRKFSHLAFPSQPKFEGRTQIGGGFVLEPKYGLYSNVVCFDFAGMYPSIIRTFNLCYEKFRPYGEGDFSLIEDDIKELLPNIQREPFKTSWMLDSPGFMAQAIEDLLNLRKEIKNSMKSLDPDSIEYKVAWRKQYALKRPINAAYGMNVYPKFRLFRPEIGATITYIGRQTVQYVSRRIEEIFGDLKVVYNDTDSTYITFPTYDEEYMKKVCDVVNESIIPEWVDKLTGGKHKKNYMMMDYEDAYDKVLLIKKRRYICRTIEDGKKKFSFKGVDIKRTSIPNKIRNMLKEYVEFLFDGKDKVSLLRELIKEIKSEKNPLELCIPLKISKDYGGRNLPQLRAAKWSNENIGTNYKKGSKFYGLYVKQHELIGFTEVEQIKQYLHLIDYDKLIDVFIAKVNNLEDKRISLDLLQNTTLTDFF